MPYDQYEAWLASRPPEVAELCREFPPGFQMTLPGGQVIHMIGVGETEGGPCVLIFSKLDPMEDYAAAVADDMRLQAHPDCVRAHLRGEPCGHHHHAGMVTPEFQ